MLLYKAKNSAYVPFVLLLPNNKAVVLDFKDASRHYYPDVRDWHSVENTSWKDDFHPPVDVSNNIGPILHALFEELTKREDV